MIADAGTPTPRTDSFMRELSCPNIELPAMWYEYAKGLERELTALRTAHEAAQTKIVSLENYLAIENGLLVAAQAELAVLDAQRMRMADALKEIIDTYSDEGNMQAGYIKLIAVRAFTKPLDAAIDAEPSI